MLHDRGSLPPGYLARAENKRLRDGVAKSRLGTALPADFNPGFIGEIVGSAVYNNPNGSEVMLIAEANQTYVWALQHQRDPIKINLETPQSIGGKTVEFVQAFDKVLLLRRPNPPTGGVPILQWDGNFTTKLFKPVTVVVPPGANLVKAHWNGEPFADRVIYYNALYPGLPVRDQVTVSDVLNYTSYDEPLGVFRINAGESNMITRVMSYFRSSIVVFMKQSIHMLTNFTKIDDVTLLPVLGAAQQRMLASIGSVGNKMPLQDGADIIFLSQPDGFYRLGEVIQDQIAVQPIPISRGIQPLIDDIHWTRAYQWACSAGLGDYAYFALPLKGKSGANDILCVYNRTTREWESAPDKWVNQNFRIRNLLTTLYDGKRELFAVADDGGNNAVYMLNTGFEDEIAGAALPVEDLIETRGYTLRDPAAFKRMERAIISLSTYDPEAKITAINDGNLEEKELATVSKNRVVSYIHGTPDLVNPPALQQPRREDYSEIPELDFAGEDFENYPDGPITFLRATPTGFNGVKQQSLERFQIRQNARWVSIRIANTQGQCDVLSVAVEGFNTQETNKVTA